MACGVYEGQRENDVAETAGQPDGEKEDGEDGGQAREPVGVVAVCREVEERRPGADEHVPAVRELGAGPPDGDGHAEQRERVDDVPAVDEPDVHVLVHVGADEQAARETGLRVFEAEQLIRKMTQEAAGGIESSVESLSRILVTAASPHVPTPLVDQLLDGGRIVLPVGGENEQTIVCVDRRGSRTIETPMLACRFVKLIGEQGGDGN